MAQNHLHYGDNLKVLREHVADQSVDLVYLDPPFNSNRAYNVLFHRDGHADSAQMQAFDDTWHWTPETEIQYDEAVNGGVPFDVADALGAFRTLLGEGDMMAYLINMAPRLVELRRVLKPTGSLYLHCDPTASHYLKLLLDAIFGPERFRNEIIWKRTTAHSSAKKFAPIHDVLLYYGVGKRVVWNTPRTDYSDEYLDRYYKFDDGDGRLYWRADLTGAGIRHGETGQPWRGLDPTPKGRHWMLPPDELDRLDREGRIYWAKGGTGWPQHKRYREDLKGRAVADIWDDVDRINPVGNERLGYPTQKPVALVERIIAASSGKGDVVLDPFCGCGTTIAAATHLDRRWIGIDVTYIAVDLIRKRLIDSYGPGIESSYDVTGIPEDLLSAQALFERSPFEFERWAVSKVDGTPNERQVGDKGFDGLIRFHHSSGKGPADGKILVSVKGGKQLNPSMVQALDGAMTTHKAHMGVFVSLNPVTKGMREIADRAGNYTWLSNGQHFPRIQIVTVPELLAGKKIQSPPRLLPYISAVRQVPAVDQVALDI
jgi:DNA modification methylase